MSVFLGVGAGTTVMKAGLSDLDGRPLVIVTQETDETSLLGAALIAATAGGHLTHWMRARRRWCACANVSNHGI